MLYLYALLCTYFICNIALKWVSLYVYNRWNKVATRQRCEQKESFWIIIPVYKEKNTVEKSYRYFAKIVNKSTLDINVIYVCTKREEDGETIKVLQRQHKNKKIRVLNAIRSRKFMAGQINFAIKYIDHMKANYKIAIYNVDSRPDLSSLEYNFCMLNKHPVIQQYGNYSNNIPKNSTGIKDFIYLNTFFWQNSWSKLFEIRNTIWNTYLPRFTKFSYVVGHGMFMNRWVLNKIGLLSERIQNEDMELSIRLHGQNIPIVAGTGFSNSDMPLNLIDYIKQQSVWARGPLLAFGYIKNKKQVVPAIKLFLHFLYWICEPWFMVGVMLIPFVYKNIYLIIFSLSLYVIYFLSVLVLPNKEHSDQVIKHPIKYFVACFCFFVIHSFGPILAIKNIVLEKLGLKKEYKFKTPKS